MRVNYGQYQSPKKKKMYRISIDIILMYLFVSTIKRLDILTKSLLKAPLSKNVTIVF